MSGGDVTAAAVSALATTVIALAVVLGRTRERLAVLEEWARLRESDRQHDKEQRSP